MSNETHRIWLINELKFMTRSLAAQERLLAVSKQRFFSVIDQLANYEEGRCGILDQHKGMFCDLDFGHDGLHEAGLDGERYQFDG